MDEVCSGGLWWTMGRSVFARGLGRARREPVSIKRGSMLLCLPEAASECRLRPGSDKSSNGHRFWDLQAEGLDFLEAGG